MDKELENLRANKTFQVLRDIFQGNRARGKWGTTRKASWGSGSCKIRRDLFALEVKDWVVTLPYRYWS